MHNYTAFKWFAGDVSRKPDRPAGLELSGLTTEVTPSVCVGVGVCLCVYICVFLCTWSLNCHSSWCALD